MRIMQRLMTTLGLAVVSLTVVGIFASVTAPEVIAQIRAALVKNVDEPGRSPYHSNVLTNGVCAPVTTCHFEFAPVPPNKRLVITNVSGLLFREPAMIALVSDVHPCINCFIRAILNVPTSTNLSGDDTWSFNEQVHVTYNAGETPRVKTFFNTTGTAANQAINVHGYLVDLGI